MNIDAKLRGSGSATPRRRLRADFTHTITNHIEAHPRPKWRLSPKGILVKLFDKPAMAVAGIVATLVISGTAYAAVVHWPNISAMFGGEQPTTNGRIVKVDITNCHTDNAFTITKPQDQRGGPRYFMVKKESTLTNEQITQMVLGNCEQGAQSDVLIDKTKNLRDSQNIIGGYDSIITAVSPGSITLQADISMGGNMQRITKTFNRIDPEVQVYYKADTLQFGDLRVGDRVIFSYRAEGEALNHSETLNPNDLQTDETTIVLIVKNTPDVTAAIEYQKNAGKEFEEVVPCETNPTGYCNTEEYYKNRMQ